MKEIARSKKEKQTTEATDASHNEKTGISSVMTENPYTIAKGSTAKYALEFMRQHNVRHLPILEATRFVGIVTHSAIHALTATEQDTFKVEEILNPEPFVVSPNTPVIEVLNKMREAKSESVIVCDRDGTLAGIFTTMDALRLLSQVFREHGPEVASRRALSNTHKKPPQTKRSAHKTRLSTHPSN